ncbi:hypothetical protein [Fervidobacterium sp.]
MAFVIYGVNEMSEDFGGATHLGLLTLDEAQDLEFGDFFREDEANPARFEDRLVVVEDFPALARAEGLPAAEYLGQRLISAFLRSRPGEFFPFLPRHKVAYVGPVEGGHVRALVRGREWAVDVVQDPSAPPGVLLVKGIAEEAEKAKAQALETAYRVLRAL